MVHPCDMPCGNKMASGYCATTDCINPQFSNIGTAQYGKGVQKSIVTNADNIRAMSDEELAEYHADKCGCPHDPIVYGCRMETIGCTGCWLDWLRQEAETNNG